MILTAQAFFYTAGAALLFTALQFLAEAVLS